MCIYTVIAAISYNSKFLAKCRISTKVFQATGKIANLYNDIGNMLKMMDVYMRQNAVFKHLVLQDINIVIRLKG